MLTLNLGSGTVNFCLIMKKTILFSLLTILFTVRLFAQNANTIVRQNLLDENDALSFIHQNVANKTQFMIDLNSATDIASVYENHLGLANYQILQSKAQVSANSAQAVYSLNLSDADLTAAYIANSDIIVTRPCFECGDGGGGGTFCQQDRLAECYNTAVSQLSLCNSNCRNSAREASHSGENVVIIELKLYFCSIVCSNSYKMRIDNCVRTWCNPFGN